MGTQFTITATYGDETKQIVLSLPSGAGGAGWWHIYINNFYWGTLHKRNGQWVHDSNNPDEFTVDDIQLMGEKIDAEMAKKY